jgi:hypothetical protein
MTSRMIPRESIDVLRDYVDIALDAIGIDCTLYIPTNTSFAGAEKKDIYAVPTDYEYIPYSAKVFINWTPNIWKLKKLGLFLEDQLPILCWFGNKATALDGSEAGSVVAVDVCIHSYFEITPEFIPKNYKGIEQFEIVNMASKGMQDAMIRQIYSCVPRRVQI